MSSPLTITTSGHVQTWTIDQQDVGNAITGADFIEAFELAVAAANQDLNVSAIVLTGAGTLFPSGGNVKEMAARRGLFGLDPRHQRRAYADPTQRVPWALERSRLPSLRPSTAPPSAPAVTWP